MDCHNKAVYDTNYARAAAYFLSTCATEPDGKSRQEAYRLIIGLYSVFFNTPEAVGLKTVADTSFEPWEQQKGREKDIKNIRGAISRIEDVIKQLFDAVESADMASNGLLLKSNCTLLKPTLVNALRSVGCKVQKGERCLIEMSVDCASGLKELCEISRANIIHITDSPIEDKAYLYFSRCVFNPSDNWTAKAFDKILRSDGRLITLCSELEKRGYTRVDCRDGKKVSLDYIKQHGKKSEPLKMSWGERTHSGIEVSYEELRTEPCFLWIRMPMFKTVLSSADMLPGNVVRFISECTKTCNGCRYCVQTDKTKTRPLAAVIFNGKKKCPHFPGFTMNWRELSDELLDNILSLIDALNELEALK